MDSLSLSLGSPIFRSQELTLWRNSSRKLLVCYRPMRKEASQKDGSFGLGIKSGFNSAPSSADTRTAQHLDLGLPSSKAAEDSMGS